jgi:hypothetical protein
LAEAGPEQNQLFENFLAERYEGGRARVPNPNSQTRERYREVAVSTALKDPEFQRKIRVEFERWREKEDEDLDEAESRPLPREAPRTPRWAEAQEKLLGIARKGKVIAEQELGGGVNQTSVRTLRAGDAEQRFVWKPKSGERPDARIGIEVGSYHQREAAAYGFDRLLGEGTVIPPTTSTGDGSYQAFESGAVSLLDVFDPVMSVEDLADNQDFHRINVLDLVLGNEDRHPGNIMFVKDASKPGGHRFIAIDNGFTLADPSDKGDELTWNIKDPWTDIYNGSDRLEAQDALAKSTTSIDRDLHEQLQEVDHDDFVRTMVENGIKSKKAILAALVRLSAMQRDRKIVGSFTGDHHPWKFLGAQQEFQRMAAKEPKRLLDLAGDGPSLEELRATVERGLA